nr:hypothetical protein [Tanacetum cinerariifolium]
MTWRASGSDVPRTLPRQIGMPSLPFRMISGTKPEPLKIAQTGQREWSYAGRDPRDPEPRLKKITDDKGLGDAFVLPFLAKGLGGAKGSDLDKDRDGELIHSRVPVADPHLLRDTHCWRVCVRDEDRALYDEMLKLQRLGSNTETGVPYTEEEIMAIVRKGKQQGHLPGVGRVLSRCATGGYYARIPFAIKGRLINLAPIYILPSRAGPRAGRAGQPPREADKQGASSWSFESLSVKSLEIFIGSLA